MSDETNNDPGYDPNTPQIDGYANPHDTSEVDSLTGFYQNRLSNTVPATPYTLNDELTAWNNRIRLTMSLGLQAMRMTNPLMGFNHMMANNPVPTHREWGGITLITRPDLNLNYDNISNSRRMSNMAMQPRCSLDYHILAALDPDFELGFSDSPRYSNGRVKNRLGTPFIHDIPFDNLQAFIPILSTQLMSMSGAPDESIDFWMSPEGVMREQWMMADSTHEVNNSYTSSMQLTNPLGDPVMKMMSIWLEYMSGVKKGQFKPKIVNSIQRRIDYQSRAYIMRYDALGNITRFSVMNVMAPMNNNAGQAAAVDNSKPILDDDATVSLQWQCIGARYFDPLYMDAFNDTVATFNPDMMADPRSDEYVPIGASSLVPIAPELLPLFNYYGYPHIDSVRRKLTWYVYQADYDYILKQAGLIK